MDAEFFPNAAPIPEEEAWEDHSDGQETIN